jgi:hypothetical protein
MPQNGACSTWNTPVSIWGAMFHVEQMLSILITNRQFPTYALWKHKKRPRRPLRRGKRLSLSHSYQLDSKRVNLRRKLAFQRRAVTNVIPAMPGYPTLLGKYPIPTSSYPDFARRDDHFHSTFTILVPTSSTLEWPLGITKGSCH